MSQPLHALALTLAGVSAIATVGITTARPAAPCNVVGTWALVSVTSEGETTTGLEERKIVSRKHFMWIAQEPRRDTLPHESATDSMRINRVDGGSGTWTLSGNRYVEHIDMFSDPSWVKTDFKATCRTTANHWTHTYMAPAPANSMHAGQKVQVVEEWRRIE
jgi:hypothetical protein